MASLVTELLREMKFVADSSEGRRADVLPGWLLLPLSAAPVRKFLVPRGRPTDDPR
jgi:hypothetical protein